MKKRILSFLLAVITVFHILPWSILPVVAEDGFLNFSDLEVGKLYSAVFDYSEYQDIYLYKPDDADRTQMVEYYGSIMKAELPQDLIIQLVEEGDFYVYVVNEDWPLKYDAYRYIDPAEIKIIGEISETKVGVTYNGEAVDEIVLFEDGKMPLTAQKPEDVTGEVTWSWEILVDAENGTWAKIHDKVKDVCDITYALVVNVLDENGEAKVRAVANDGEDAYKSDPITVKAKYIPKPIDDVYENAVTESALIPSVASDGIARLSTGAAQRSGLAMLAADGSTATDRITITVNFIKVRPDGTQVQASYPDIRTLKTDYEAYEVQLPSVLGYYPSLTAPSNPYDFSKNPSKDDSLTTVSIEAEKTVDYTLNVYYYPGEAKYVVYHYMQNVNDDNYTLYSETTGKGIVDKAVPDSHQTLEGFRHLYYEHTEVAADGSTIIEIYYDREYFTVLFDLDKKGAYGQENLYVKYEASVSINDPTCIGWKFSGWEVIEDEEGNYSNLAGGTENQIIVRSSVTYKAIWEGVASAYSIVYWLENANDGNYSVWYTPKEQIPSISGTVITWEEGEILQELEAIAGYEFAKVEALEEYGFSSLNSSKTVEEMGEGVIVEGDKSTTLNVFFNRRVYDITFEAAPNPALTHSHTAGYCEFNPMFCTHVHTDECTVSTHTHTSSCTRTCGIAEHMHNEDCCDTHIHQLSCYSDKAEVFTGEFADYLLEKVKDQLSEDGNWLGWISAQVTVTSKVKEVSANMGERVAQKAPPKNLQNGYVQILTGETEKLSWEGWLTTYTVTPTFDVSAIYIDGEWYYYSGSMPNGSVETVTTSICEEPIHDHTSGCTYGTKCTASEHVHNDDCYSCGLANGTCPHQHTADCYGNVCMVPTYDATKNITAIKLQAKYGQDITAYLPYYLELYANGLHQNSAGENFVGWQYAGTGWADTGETRYVKHVTMVSELCYSEGVTATAQYDPLATNAYVLYYLFESFDQTSVAKDYAIDGSGRQQLGTKWYDSDPLHVQLVMWPTAGGLIPDGEKGIEGMTFVETAGNPATGTLNLTIGSITSETLNAYFYDRETVNSLTFHNNMEAILTIPKAGKANPLKYGINLGDLVAALKNSADYGNFDVNDLPYPSTLEANAYVFDGWYTTPYKSNYTKVDWESATLPAGNVNLYALWKPVTRYVEVYEDATLDKPFADTNHGYQEVGHNSYAYEPDYKESRYYTDGYRFNGWFYVDSESGEEKAFLFNFAVTQDMKIYAKWTLDATVSYKINYVTYVGGERVQIADSLFGNALAGQNKTFRALAGNSLYADYQEGFFPQVGSHTVQMLYILDENGNPVVNEYDFVYDEVEKVPYWVRYVDAETDEVLLDETRYETRKAAVTELFVPIEKYTVDQYSKSLILSTTDPEVNNVITFYYTKNEEAKVYAPWVVNHLIQNADGTYSVYKYESGTGEVLTDDTDVYYGTVLTDIVGYTFARADVETRVLNGSVVESVTIPLDNPIDQNGNKMYGYELNEYGMEINLYYDRDKVGYTVQYKDANTDEVFYSYVVAADDSVPHGDLVTVTLNETEHMKIVLNKGCQLIDTAETRSLTLYIDESRNVITFLYQAYDATFEYQIVCDDENSGVGLSRTREVTAAGSNISLIGAYPFESETYYFAGWFADAECTMPITADTIVSENYSVMLDATTQHLIPTKTAFTYDGTEGNLYLSATYYALFLPRSADLTVTVTSGQSDSFILTFTGVEDTFAEGTTFTVAVQDGVALNVTDVPIGTYTVVSDSKWSWRYQQINERVDVVVKDGGTISISVNMLTDQWLSADANGVYTGGSN